MHHISPKRIAFYRHFLTLLLCAGLALFTIGCSSSGSSGGGSGTTDSGSTIEGTVSGTIVMAVNDSGEVIDSHDTTGTTPDLDSDGDGEEDVYSFELTGIPANTAIRIYLISDGQIFPMYFASTSGGTPDTNVFSISSNSTIDLGGIDISSGKAVPDINPITVANVTAGAENPDIPDEILEPDTTGLSAADLIDKGFGYLVNGGFHMAKTYLAEATDATTAGTGQGDQARFFYAAARVAAAATMTYSDGDAADLDQVGDLLDGIGMDTSGTIRSNFEAMDEALDAMASLSTDSPDGSDIQTLIKNALMPEITAAIVNLGQVSEDFAYANKLPHEDEEVEFDYADVLALRAGMYALLAVLQIQDAYNLDIDVDAVVKEGDDESTPDPTIESILTGDTNLLTLKTSHQLAAAKTNISNALADVDDAISAIESEEDDQEDDFINLEEASAEEIADFKEDLATARDAVDSPPTTVDDNETVDTGDDTILNASYFFGGLNLRSMLPEFDGDGVSGLFPNETFGGVIVQGLDINEDSYDEYGYPSPDDIPDILQDN